MAVRVALLGVVLVAVGVNAFTGVDAFPGMRRQDMVWIRFQITTWSHMHLMPQGPTCI